jgi:hypothetical protein
MKVLLGASFFFLSSQAHAYIYIYIRINYLELSEHI